MAGTMQVGYIVSSCFMRQAALTWLQQEDATCLSVTSTPPVNSRKVRWSCTGPCTDLLATWPSCQHPAGQLRSVLLHARPFLLQCGMFTQAGSSKGQVAMAGPPPA